MSLTGNQRSHLRALGHALSPVVQVGHQGVTSGVTGALSQALLDHELVKVKLAQAVDDRTEAVAQLASGTLSECVQTKGRTALFYKRHPKKPKIELPAPRTPPAPDEDTAG